mmetsp:Transcript_26792/g.77248  ORF Transcript_26792/g.77248 Transcript_26792/m.77248 type:complete len:240 (-) Transcript_26792:5-724(-)
MEEDLALAAHLPNLREGLEGADLIVDGHHADKDGIVPHGRLELLQIHPARGALDREVRHVESLLLQAPARVQDALVLGLGGNDVPLVLLALAVEPRDALDAHVVALGGAAGEHHLLRAGPDQPGHLRPRGFHDPLGLPPVRVRPGVGIAEAPDHVRGHGVQDAGVEGGRGRHVQVRRPAVAELAADGELLRDVVLGQEAVGRRGRRRGVPRIGRHLVVRDRRVGNIVRRRRRRRRRHET